MHHVSIFVSDMERALELFNGILGLSIVKRLYGVEGERISALLGMADFRADMVFLKHPDQHLSLELVRQISPPPDAHDRGAAGGFGLCLNVPDLDALHTRLGRAGWRPLSEPLEMLDPSGRSIRLFCFRTDEGLMVELIQQAA